MVNIELNIQWKKSAWQLNTNETFMNAAFMKFDRIVWNYAAVASAACGRKTMQKKYQSLFRASIAHKIESKKN